MKRKTLTLFLSLCFAHPLLFLLGCKDKSVEPQFKDPRTYTWTIDTLAYPGSLQTLTWDMYASTPHDVWTVGYNATSGGKMYHYDGKQWTDVKLYISQGGKIEVGINLNAVYGFSPNDIWAVGERHYDVIIPPRFRDSSLIIHFDGREWTEHNISRGGMLQSIWGSNPLDIWAAGINTLYHFNGAAWEKFPVWIPPQGIQFLRLSGVDRNSVFMIGEKNDVVQPIDTTAYYLYYFDGSRWAVIDSVIRTIGSPPAKFGRNIYAIDGILLSSEYGVYKRVGDLWERIIYTNGALTRLRGTSIQNLFAVGAESQVFHYNGSDWFRYPQFKGLDKLFTSVWATGEEVFVVGFTAGFPQKTVVLHGQ